MIGSGEKNKMYLYEKVSNDLLELNLLKDYEDPKETPFKNLSKKSKEDLMIDRLDKFDRDVEHDNCDPIFLKPLQTSRKV